MQEEPHPLPRRLSPHPSRGNSPRHSPVLFHVHSCIPSNPFDVAKLCYYLICFVQITNNKFAFNKPLRYFAQTFTYTLGTNRVVNAKLPEYEPSKDLNTFFFVFFNHSRTINFVV